MPQYEHKQAQLLAAYLTDSDTSSVVGQIFREREERQCGLRLYSCS
ncbi:MAG: hypothetical protein LUC91_06255 [Prevotella sp.]|nr:hypothetical protein [Prevotella sp.]